MKCFPLEGSNKWAITKKYPLQQTSPHFIRVNYEVIIFIPNRHLQIIHFQHEQFKWNIHLNHAYNIIEIFWQQWQTNDSWEHIVLILKPDLEEHLEAARWFIMIHNINVHIRHVRSSDSLEETLTDCSNESFTWGCTQEWLLTHLQLFHLLWTVRVSAAEKVTLCKVKDLFFFIMLNW